MVVAPLLYYKAVQLVLYFHIALCVETECTNNIKKQLLSFDSHKLSKSPGRTKHFGLSINLNKCENSTNNHLGFDEWFFHLLSTCEGLHYLENNSIGNDHEEQVGHPFHL